MLLLTTIAPRATSPYRELAPAAGWLEGPLACDDNESLSRTGAGCWQAGGTSCLWWQSALSPRCSCRWGDIWAPY